MIRIGRKTPYTLKGISRIPCAGCGNPSVHQWQVCALHNWYQGVCLKCDYALNKLVLDFFNPPNKAVLLKSYAKKINAEIKENRK